MLTCKWQSSENQNLFFNIDLCDLFETSLKFVPMNNMPAFVQFVLMSFKCIFFSKFMITQKISPEMSLQGKLPFYECTYTCLINITSMYPNTIYLYCSRPTFYAEGSLYIHLIMPTCFMLLCFTHVCILQNWRSKDIYFHYQLRTYCDLLTHTCVRNLTWHSLW